MRNACKFVVKMAGIYIHIPFCKQACHYCDFHFSTNQEKKNEMVEMMQRELALQHHYLSGEVIETIYFGGGTPSLLSTASVASLLKSVYDHYQVAAHAEITLEVNPDDLTAPYLDALRAMGVNRLSVGIQSFDDQVLHFLNRAHNSVAATNSLLLAKAAGFHNISLDLIYAIPGQGLDTWRKNIEQALAVEPAHISAYALTIEEKTAFGQWAKKGTLKPVEDDDAATDLDWLVNTLDAVGYEHYEVSNFAKPGFYSRHNTSYWQQKKYLGIGPSAHSYNLESRQYNISNNHVYLQGLREGRIPFTEEHLTPADRINDYLLTTLRTAWGSNLAVLRDEMGYDLLAQHAPYIESLMAKNFVLIDNGILKLTRSGKLLADKISSDLFVVTDA